MKWKVFITRKIPSIGIDLLTEAGMRIEVYPHDNPIPESVLLEKIADCDALLCLLTDSISSRTIEVAERLKIIANYAVGYNNIDLPAASRRGIVVTNTPDVLTEATADLAFALILACARRIIEGDQIMRAGNFTGWSPQMLLGAEVYGRTIGIIGAGRIGTALAKRAYGFGMTILYSDTIPNRLMEEKFQARQTELEQVIRQSDFISLHVPLTAGTYHLIDEQRLMQMKPSAFLINTSRGAVIDEAALVRALKKNVIAGAGLDVYEQEPLLADDLNRLEHVVLLPHLGSATVQTRNKMAELAAKNIISLAVEKHAPNAVNLNLIEKMK
jgi:glyoxylate reductase